MLPPFPSLNVTVYTSVSVSPAASACACALLGLKIQPMSPATLGSVVSEPAVSAMTPATKVPIEWPDFNATETVWESLASASVNDSVPSVCSTVAWISSTIVADTASPAWTVMVGASLMPLTVKVSVRCRVSVPDWTSKAMV